MAFIVMQNQFTQEFYYYYQVLLHNNHHMQRSQDRTYSPLRRFQKETVTPNKTNPYSNHSGALQGSYSVPPNYPDETRCSQNAYLQSQSMIKRPKAYCPLSRKMIDSQNINQIIRKGIDYSNSKEFAQFKQVLTKVALTQQQIIAQMKQVRNNKVYLPKRSKIFGNNCLSGANYGTDKAMITEEREYGKQDEVKTETISFSIDQLSKIEQKDTLLQDYRLGASKTEFKHYNSRSSYEKKKEVEQYPVKINMGSREWQHPIMIKQEPQEASQSIIYPHPSHSPLHNRVTYSDIKPRYKKQQNDDKVVTIRTEHKIKKSLERCKQTLTNQWSSKKNAAEKGWNIKKDKENINYQPKQGKKAAQKTCKTASDTLQDTFYGGHRQIRKEKIAEGDIYNIDFKLVRPAIEPIPINKLGWRSSNNKKLEPQRSQEHLTPMKPRDQDQGVKTRRYLNNSKENSERSNRSISKGKLSVVSASKRHH